jgi:hypothetical protein
MAACQQMMLAQKIAAGSSVLLLDETFTVTAYAAYSLRKLRSGYAGSAIKVRRSSDNATADIGFSGDNLDTAALLTHCGAGDGFVDTWYDQTTNARNMTQSTAANQPRIVASGAVIVDANSKPRVELDGSNDLMATASLSPGLPLSHMTVVSNDSIVNSDLIVHGNGPSSVALKQISSTGNKFRLSSGTNLTDTTSTTNGTTYIVTCTVETGATDSIQVNANTAVTGEAGDTIVSAGLAIGSSTVCADANISEVVWLAGTFSSGDRTTLRNNMNAHFAVY